MPSTLTPKQKTAKTKSLREDLALVASEARAGPPQSQPAWKNPGMLGNYSLRVFDICIRNQNQTALTMVTTVCTKRRTRKMIVV